VFAFIDSTDEVTRFFDTGSDLGAAMSRIMRESELITYDGHSDYGNAFETFDDKYAHTVTSRTSVLVLGDGRTNYRDPKLGALARTVAVAKHAYWLNPEPKGQWGSGDSAAGVYSEVIGMYECRSAQQLSDIVSRLLPV
jgi:uncharacterized protein with von Willebrand factor type A (vWA) domain